MFTPHTAFRRNSLFLCIAAASLLPGGSLLAQSATSEAIETIVVTGSRSLERSILESPVPVDTFDAEDVRESGALAGELGEALATLVPSFNFLRQSNSGTSDHVRAGQLRGLSPDQMLVLVNGKRRHTSAVVNSETKIGRGTAAVDFNTLPLNAVHHVEVLRDGAGAQYGSDAIGGVVNLILDRESLRPEFNVGYGAHVTDFDAIDEDITDGQTLTLDGKAGLNLAGGGFFNAGFDVKRRNATDRAGFDTIPFFYPATPANLALTASATTPRATRRCVTPICGSTPRSRSERTFSTPSAPWAVATRKAPRSSATRMNRAMYRPSTRRVTAPLPWARTAIMA